MDVNSLLLDKVADSMSERGISAEDLCQVIAWGEGEGGKLVDGDRCLAKKRINNVSIYAEYTVDGDKYIVEDTYSHRVSFREDA